MLIDVPVKVAVRILVSIKEFFGTGAVRRYEFDGCSVGQRSDGRCPSQRERRSAQGSLAG